jgi:hypothetical protein
MRILLAALFALVIGATSIEAKAFASPVTTRVTPAPPVPLVPYSWPIAISVPVTVSTYSYSTAHLKCDLTNPRSEVVLGSVSADVPTTVNMRRLHEPANMLIEKYSGTMNLSITPNIRGALPGGILPPVAGAKILCELFLEHAPPTARPGEKPTGSDTVQLILPSPLGAPSKWIMPPLSIVNP